MQRQLCALLFCKFQICRRTPLPSAYQIRCGGAKGMVALDPGLQGLKLQLRPSMIKFTSKDDDKLELLEYSKPSKWEYNYKFHSLRACSYRVKCVNVFISQGYILSNVTAPREHQSDRCFVYLYIVYCSSSLRISVCSMLPLFYMRVASQ